MNQKFKIVDFVLDQLKKEKSTKNFKKVNALLWKNPRTKSVGGLELTKNGFKTLTDLDVKCHKIRFEKPISLDFSNETILQFDRLIDCPWYIEKNQIYVFNDRVAVQLILFSGNIEKFLAYSVAKRQLDNKEII